MLKSLIRKLYYFNKIFEEIIAKMQRQYSHLKGKLEKAYELIREIQDLHLEF